MLQPSYFWLLLEEKYRLLGCKKVFLFCFQVVPVRHMNHAATLGNTMTCTVSGKKLYFQSKVFFFHFFFIKGGGDDQFKFGLFSKNGITGLASP